MTKDICIKVVQSLFDTQKGFVDLNNYDYIFINLNSILNSMFYPEMESEINDEFIEELKVTFRAALMNTYRADKTYYVYYSTKPSNNKDNYPEWDSILNKCKFNEKFYTVFSDFITAMKILESKFTNIKMIDTEDMESAYIPYLFWKTHMRNSRSIIISRDQMDFLNIKYGFHLYDSTTLMIATDNHNSNKIPKIHKNLISYFMFMLGIEKHSYNGIRGYAKKKAMDYLMKNVDNLKTDPLFNDKAFNIFSHKKFIDNNPELLEKYTNFFNNINI